MKNNITELVFILDRSGSMGGLVSDTIGGFNAMIERQKKEDGVTLVTTVLFDTRIDRLHDRLPIAEVPAMTEREYVPGGCTALLDAVGSTIRHIAQIHRYARAEDVPEKTLFVITTDGLENASRRYRLDEVRKLIEHEKEKYGWEFLFLGANIDAVGTAAGLGIGADRSVNFVPDGRGLDLCFETVGDAICDMKRRAPLSSNWSMKVDRDYKNRGKK